jgi:hypothetical protein
VNPFCAPEFRNSFATGHLVQLSSSAVLIPAAPSASVANEALASFYKNARERQNAFQGGVFLGEIVETLRLIKNPLRALRESVDSHLRTVKKRSKGINRLPPGKRGPKALRVASDTWLETAFGWRPLLHDVRDACDYLARRNLELYPRVEIYGSAKSETGTNTSGRFSWGGVGQRFSIFQNTRVITSLSVRYLGAVDVRPVSSLGADAQLLGFTGEDFAPTLWELLPWSFLIDYFTNVGDVIASHAFCKSRVKWVVRTDRSVKTTDVSGSIDEQTIRSVQTTPGLNGTKHVSAYVFPGILRARSKRILRSIPVGLGTPSLQFNLPGSNLKFLNIAALVASRSRNSRSPLSMF